MSKRKIVAIVLLVALMVGVLVGPTLAALTWQHEWDHRSVLFEVPPGDGYYARSEGHSGWIGLGGADKISDRTYSCLGSKSVRVTLFAEADKDVRIRVACAVMTPTVAPTRRP
jgi:hypothetical protein